MRRGMSVMGDGMAAPLRWHGHDAVRVRSWAGRVPPSQAPAMGDRRCWCGVCVADCAVWVGPVTAYSTGKDRKVSTRLRNSSGYCHMAACPASLKITSQGVGTRSAMARTF